MKILTVFVVGVSTACQISVRGPEGERCSLQLEAEEVTLAELYKEVGVKLNIGLVS